MAMNASFKSFEEMQSGGAVQQKQRDGMEVGSGEEDR